MRSARWTFGATATLAAVALAPWGAHLARGETPRGLRIDGAALAPSDAPGREIRRRAGHWLSREVHVDADELVRRPTRAALGVTVDSDAVVARARRLGRTGNPLGDLPALLRAWSGHVDLPWPVAVDEARLRAFVDALGPEIDRPARPALVDPDGRLLELSADGARLDRDAAVATLRGALEGGRRTVHLQVTRIPSGVGDAALEPALHPEARPVVIGRYSTELETRGSERDRAHNVATAAGFLDGATIAPHGRLSFNDRVGARSRERGYRLAHVIVDGEMVDGLGGGVCQVASTLHAAAFLAGLDVVDHTPHSRPSSYIPMGLDATVVWSSVNLVLANPHPFPITVRAWMRDGRMTVELFGRRRARRVTWDRRTLSTQGWSDRYVEDPEVPEGERRVTQRGIRGHVILRQRTIEDGSGVHLEETRLRYPPTDRIIRVAPGTLDPETGEPRAEPVAAVPPNPF